MKLKEVHPIPRTGKNDEICEWKKKEERFSIESWKSFLHKPYANDMGDATAEAYRIMNIMEDEANGKNDI